MIIRPATLEDAPAVAAIYAHHVLHGSGTFEEVPPSASEMAARMAALLDRGLPYHLAELDGRVLAYAYAGPFRQRAAYRYTVEDSVYVAVDAQRRGAGRAVLGRVIEACEAMGLRQMLAVIGGSENAGSIGLHAALGFERLGDLPGLGFKHDRWLDLVFMQRPLNGGTATPPSGPGLSLQGS